MELLVVRHAHAGDRATWTGEDRIRPLTERGVRQAAALAGALAASGPARILTSPATRCRQTVEPLGAATGITVSDDKRLFEGTHGPDIASLVDDAAGEIDTGSVVLCTHGDIVPRILDELIDRGLHHEGRMEWSKASTWVIRRIDGDWRDARYLPPPDRA